MKTAFLIDGSNFYHRLKRCCIQHSSCFDYGAFAGFLLSPGDDLCYVGYYVGLVQVKAGDSKSELLYAGQQRLFVNLKRFLPNIRIVLGHIQNVKGIFQEKGVDVRLALDIYRLSYEQQFEKIILLSSDADLLPAVTLVQQAGCIVEYVGLHHYLSQALLKNCYRQRVLSCSDLKPFEQPSHGDSYVAS